MFNKINNFNKKDAGMCNQNFKYFLIIESVVLSSSNAPERRFVIPFFLGIQDDF